MESPIELDRTAARARELQVPSRGAIAMHLSQVATLSVLASAKRDT